MPSKRSSNVYSMPSYGKAIALDDQGVYYTLNQHTGQVHSVFQLVYADDWYLYQMQKTAVEDEVSWHLMSDAQDLSLRSMTCEEITYHLSKPEYSEPKGAWQVLRNSKYGFAKFTPLNSSAPLRFAILVFEGEQMLMPVLIHKVEEQVQVAQETMVSLA